MRIETFLTNQKFPGWILFAKLWGSRSHNCHMPYSDYDFAGVYVCPTKDMLSLSPPSESCVHDEKSEASTDCIDYQFHELHKFCQLLLKGNPAIVEMLFTERDAIAHPVWYDLRSIRHKFLSRDVVNQYLGYMQGQLKRLVNNNYLHTTGGKYNEKWGYHILRLGEDALRIALGKEPVVWKDGAERDFLMRVRNYECKLEDVRDMVEKKIKIIEDAAASSSLPDRSDKEALNQWLLSIRFSPMCISKQEI